MATSTIVLITGANTGLGFQIVRALYASNVAYTILLGGRSLEKATTASNLIAEEFPSSKIKIEAVSIDISSDESIQHLFDDVNSRYGRLDVLINNAGRSQVNTYICRADTPKALSLKESTLQVKWLCGSCGTNRGTSTLLELRS